MGIIIAKFRKKKTTEQILEKVDKEIKSIETYRRNTEQAQKKIVGRFLLISVIIYLGTAFVFYFYFFPATFYDQLFYVIPLILAPVIIISTKKGLTWYYNRKISKKQEKLIALHEEKKKILENVMETETYKVAKNILEKYAPEQIRRSSLPVPSASVTPIPVRNNSSSAIIPSATELRHRALPPPTQPSRSSYDSMQTPARPSLATRSATVSRLPVVPVGATPFVPSVGIPGTPLPLPRAILPRERSVLDKMVEYLVGDGPSNRYALICRQCSSHNGMALREEFEYLSFRCCYCYAFNPARKKRPIAPKLEIDVKTPLAIQAASDSSESERNSPSETDSDLENGKIKDVNLLYTPIEKENGDLSSFVGSDQELQPSREKENVSLNPFEGSSDDEAKPLISPNVASPIEKHEDGLGILGTVNSDETEVNRET